MLHIILTILLTALKVIGILLLALLCLVLFLLCLVLFVPIRYHADSVFHDDKKGVTARITWLFHLISIRIAYEPEYLIKAKVFGIQVFPKKKKTRKRREKSQKKEEQKQEDNQKEESPKIAEKETPAEQEKTEPEIPKQPKIEPELPEQKTSQPEQKQESEEPKEEENKNPEPEPYESLSDFSPKKVWESVKSTIDSIRTKRNDIRSSVETLKEKAERLLSFLREETTKSSVTLIKSRLFTILKHAGPRKVKGNLRFGTPDPALTGQILGAISIFYGRFAGWLELEPDFTQAVLEGDIHIKGHARLIHVGVGAIVLLLDKGVRGMIESYKKL